MKKQIISSIKVKLFNLGFPMILNKSNNLKLRKIRLNGKIAGKIHSNGLVVYLDKNLLDNMLEGGIK